MTKEKRPLVVAEAVAMRLSDLLAPSCDRLMIGGSIRRRRPDVGDIELIAIPRVVTASSDSLADLFGFSSAAPSQTLSVNLLWKQLDSLKVEYSKKGPRYRRFEYDGWEVDCFTADRDNYGMIALIRTGSAEFSQWVMGELNKAGLTSSEGRLHKRAKQPTGEYKAVGDAIRTPEEIDVFRAAGHQYLDPPQRNHAPGVWRR